VHQYAIASVPSGCTTLRTVRRSAESRNVAYARSRLQEDREREREREKVKKGGHRIINLAHCFGTVVIPKLVLYIDDLRIIRHVRRMHDSRRDVRRN